MNKLTEYQRCNRLIESIISDLELDLTGIRVLTETGSGAFVLTPIIAAFAGADSVVAVTSDSPYGLGRDVKKYTEEWAIELGVMDVLHVSLDQPRNHATNVDLVTNLGFVRPLDKAFLSLLPENAAVTLMWEPWEYRSDDLDLSCCHKKNIPVLGTNEQDARLKIFKYVGMLAIKLLLEARVEVFQSKIIVIGSGVFGRETLKAVQNNGGNCVHYDPTNEWPIAPSKIAEDLFDADGIVVVENQYQGEIIGGYSGISPEFFQNGIKFIHICGNVHDDSLKYYNISKIPHRNVKPGYMTVTTDYLGPRPVIDLHAAGLKVGESLVRGMRRFGTVGRAIDFALEHSPALKF